MTLVSGGVYWGGGHEPRGGLVPIHLLQMLVLSELLLVEFFAALIHVLVGLALLVVFSIPILVALLLLELLLVLGVVLLLILELRLLLHIDCSEFGGS